MGYVSAARAQAAAEVLGIDDIDAVNNAAVALAFRSLSKQHHPDTAENYDQGKWIAITTAKTTLVEWLEGRRGPLGGAKPSLGGCAACGGSGAIQTRSATGFGMGPRMRCVLCEGTGTTRRADREQ